MIRGLAREASIFTEWIWLYMVIWIFTVLLSRYRKDQNLQALAAVLGVIFGILMLGVSALLALALIAINLYLLYDALD